jgi:polysaccharide export outer membrane protein
MKPGSLLAVAVLVPALFCPAQVKTPAVQDAAKPAVPDSYIIGASDNISVTVFKEPTLSSSLLVRPDGMISMPLLGDVKAAGKTTTQLADDITARLKKYVQDPNVTVVLGQVNSKKIYLLGEVSKPGPVEMTPGMTFLQAIATAGGLTQFANSKRIYILRIDGGKERKIPMQYKRALKGDISLNLDLNPGDTIVVP